MADDGSFEFADEDAEEVSFELVDDELESTHALDVMPVELSDNERLQLAYEVLGEDRLTKMCSQPVADTGLRASNHVGQMFRHIKVQLDAFQADPAQSPLEVDGDEILTASQDFALINQDYHDEIQRNTSLQLQQAQLRSQLKACQTNMSCSRWNSSRQTTTPSWHWSVTPKRTPTRRPNVMS